LLTHEFDSHSVVDAAKSCEQEAASMQSLAGWLESEATKSRKQQRNLKQIYTPNMNKKGRNDDDQDYGRFAETRISSIFLRD
jgi:hypothetical protein